MNTVLRLDPESDITLFRVLMPFGFLYFAVTFKRQALLCILTILCLLAYGALTTFFLSRFDGFSVVHFLHYATLIFLLFFSFSITEKFGIQSVYTHLRNVYILMIVLAVMQFFTDYEFPNTEYLGTINIFYLLDNDFGAALAAFVPLLLIDEDHPVTSKLLAFAGTLIMAYNSSRIALLSILFFVLFFLLNKVKWLGPAISIVASVSLLVVFREYQIGGDSLHQLLVVPLGHIFTLTPYGSGGSIYDRTNALIFGIKELASSGGFGIGPGNATRMFALPEYHLPSAQSMHNFVAQVFVEYGWLMLLFCFYFVFKVSQWSNAKLTFIYFAAIGFASLSQSEGLFSNYYFFVSVFLGFKFLEGKAAQAGQFDGVMQ